MIPTEYYRTVRRESLLVCYWRMNDKEGTRALDWAGKYNLNGIYNGSPVNGVPLISADIAAGSKIFGGENQNIEVPDAVPLRVIGDITIEMWIIVLAAAQTCSIMGKMNGAFTFPNPYQLELDNGKLVFSLGNGVSETVITTSTSLPVSIPLHIVASSFRKSMKLTVNGTEVYSGKLGEQEVKDGGKPIYVGELGNNKERFNGMIGELALYSGALGSTRINEHFAIGRQIIFKKPYYTNYDPPSYS